MYVFEELNFDQKRLLTKFICGILNYNINRPEVYSSLDCLSSYPK